MLRLLARAVDQPDDRESRDAGLKVGLYLDTPRLESDESVSNRTREHPFDDRRGGLT
jgi:hypothetical protein